MALTETRGLSETVFSEITVSSSDRLLVKDGFVFKYCCVFCESVLRHLQVWRCRWSTGPAVHAVLEDTVR